MEPCSLSVSEVSGMLYRFGFGTTPGSAQDSQVTQEPGMGPGQPGPFPSALSLASLPPHQVFLTFSPGRGVSHTQTAAEVRLGLSRASPPGGHCLHGKRLHCGLG